MNTLGFIIPLKPKSQSKDWAKVCALLKATITSLLNQTSTNFKIYVVFTDDPKIEITSERLIFIHFPFPFATTSEILESETILYRFGNDPIILERRWDKSKKIFYGCKKAKEDGCKYLMCVDSDDLVSNKIVAHIEKKLEENATPGFYIEKGYLYRSGKKRMIYISRDFQNFNGSTHIIREDFITIPDFEKGVWMDYNLFTSHGWIRYRLNETYGIELDPIAFPAVIYVAHGGNISNVCNLTMKEKMKNFVKLILRGQWIDTNIKKEFSIAGHE